MLSMLLNLVYVIKFSFLVFYLVRNKNVTFVLFPTIYNMNSHMIIM